VTTRFIWEGARLLQEIQNEVPLTYVYSDQHSHEPLARIDGMNTPDIFWFHNQPNGTPERLTDAEGKVCWKGQNSAWGKLLHERDVQLPYAQNLRMQGSIWIGTNLSGTNLNACSATPEGRATGKWRVNRTSL
jgi:uncharacterized protein RhaS with RHS repeats